MIAGELPSDPNKLSDGSGPVTIDANVIQANLASDDGGGIRLLQTSGDHITAADPQTIRITNNTIANNVSAHEGGGIALDDAASVDIVNNTVAKNLTTATAVTSDGLPAPAGLSTASNSKPLNDKLSSFQGGSSTSLSRTSFSKPTLFNNVFWDNRAGSFSGGIVTGIGGTLPDGTVNTVNVWDMGVADGSGVLTPTYSVFAPYTGLPAGPDLGPVSSHNSTGDPSFVTNYDVTVNILASRMYPAFRQSVIVAQILSPDLMGNYHLAPASNAKGWGTASQLVTWVSSSRVVAAPQNDIDTAINVRGPRYDAGSDQLVP
jgi:hypothetical protein